MSVTERQIRLDYHRFSTRYKVALTHKNRRIVIKNFDYPDGWVPRTAPFLIRYPEQYPQMQPAFYVPDHLEYTRYAGRIHNFRRDTLNDGWWVRWCTHYNEAWRRDVEHFIKYWIRPSLASPQKNNPAQEA